MKTIRERIREILKNENQKINLEEDSFEKIVMTAYYLGRESATREVSDAYKLLIADQRKKAENNRYRHMINDIIGNRDYIYFPDYSGDFVDLFGNDKTAF